MPALRGLTVEGHPSVSLGIGQHPRDKDFESKSNLTYIFTHLLCASKSYMLRV